MGRIVTLVDTDILIDAGRGVAEALTALTRLRPTILAVSHVTAMELLVGCRNQAEWRATEQFLRQFQIVRLDAAISDQAFDLLRQYRLSHGLLIADLLIAASALVLNEPLISKNRRDFRFIAGLQLLPYP